MRRNLFPNVTTIGVITISVLIFSAFSLIAFNLASFLKIWEDKIEVIAYLKRKTPAERGGNPLGQNPSDGGSRIGKICLSLRCHGFYGDQTGQPEESPGGNSANGSSPFP